VSVNTLLRRTIWQNKVVQAVGIQLQEAAGEDLAFSLQDPEEINLVRRGILPVMAGEIFRQKKVEKNKEVKYGKNHKD
jgi:hypothetical protein